MDDRPPLKLSWGGKPLPLIGPGWNHTVPVATVRDRFAIAYQAWLERTGTEPTPAAFATFHGVNDRTLHIPHSHCNGC